MPIYKKVKLGTRALSSENVSYICRATLTLILQLEQALNADPRLKKGVQKLQTDLNRFDDIEKISKTADRSNLSELDKQRDRDLASYRTYLKLKCNSRHENIRQAAEKLYLLLQSYGDLARRSHSEQSTLLVQLFKQLDTRENRSLLTQIGATEYVADLKASHEAFETNAITKIKNTKQKTGPSRTELRRALEDDYNNIYAYLLSIEHFGQDNFHKPLLAAFNQVRKDVIAKQRKTSKNNKKKAESTEES